MVWVIYLAIQLVFSLFVDKYAVFPQRVAGRFASSVKKLFERIVLQVRIRADTSDDRGALLTRISRVWASEEQSYNTFSVYSHMEILRLVSYAPLGGTVQEFWQSGAVHFGNLIALRCSYLSGSSAWVLRRKGFYTRWLFQFKLGQKFLDGVFHGAAHEKCNRDHNLGHDTWQEPLSEALLGRSSSDEPAMCGCEVRCGISLSREASNKMGIVMHSRDDGLLPPLPRCVVVGWLSAVFGCILDPSSALDDVKVVVEEGFSVFQRHTRFRADEVDTYVRVYEFLTGSSSFDVANNVVDGTQENYESVWISTEF